MPGALWLCGAMPPGLCDPPIHVLINSGRGDPVLGSNWHFCQMHRSFGFCSRGEFLPMLFTWLVAQGRGLLLGWG